MSAKHYPSEQRSHVIKVVIPIMKGKEIVEYIRAIF